MLTLMNKPFLEIFLLNSEKYKGTTIMGNHKLLAIIFVSKIPLHCVANRIANTPINNEMNLDKNNFLCSGKGFLMQGKIRSLTKQILLAFNSESAVDIQTAKSPAMTKP